MVLAAHFSLLPSSQNMNVGDSLSPPAFFPAFPSQFILNFSSPVNSPSASSLSASPLQRPSLTSIATHFCFLWSVKNDRLQDEVDRICRRNGLTKWIAAFLAIHQRSEATAVKICEGAGLLITGCYYKVSDSVFAARQRGVGGGWVGVCWRVEQNAGGCSALKNPLLIDFKWWNIDFCPGQGLAERAAAIYRRQGAGHAVLLASISHSDTGKMREEGSEGERRGSRKRNKSMASRFALPYMNQNRDWIICIKTNTRDLRLNKNNNKKSNTWTLKLSSLSNVLDCGPWAKH